MTLTLAIKSDAQILTEVRLPGKGSVLARTGDVVEAGGVVAESRSPQRFQVYDIVNNLKVEPAKVDAHMQRLVGESFVKGDVIAQKTGLIARFFRAAQDGKIASVRDGKVVLALGEQVESAVSPLPGLVADLIPERGVVIATQGALVEGLWSNGRSASGVLQRLGEELDRTVLATCKDSICVLSGEVSSARVKAVLGAKPAGLVLPAVPVSCLEMVKNADAAVLSLNGFGEGHEDDLTRELLDEMVGQTVYLLSPGEGTEAWPRLIMPKETEDSPGLFDAPAKPMLEAGSPVKVMGNPYNGSIGRLEALPAKSERFASGLLLKTAVVRRSDEDVIRVPLQNLILIDC